MRTHRAVEIHTRHMYILRGITTGLAIIISTIVLCMPLLVIGLVRLISPGRLRSILWRRMDGIVQVWVAVHRAIFAVMRVTRIHVRWDNDAALSQQCWYVVLSNHQSWADILILQNVLRDHIPMLKFFTKRELIWIPLVGITMWLLGFPYVRRLSRDKIAADPGLADLDRRATLDACRGFRDHPTSVLSFLEGTRFTPAKHDAQAARFRHLLNPKLGGVSYVVDAMREQIDKVLDVTIVYRGGVPSFWNLLEGRCSDVDVLIRSRDLPAEVSGAGDADEVRARLRPWIESIWREKDARLQSLEQSAN